MSSGWFGWWIERMELKFDDEHGSKDSKRRTRSWNFHDCRHTLKLLIHIFQWGFFERREYMFLVPVIIIILVRCSLSKKVYTSCRLRPSMLIIIYCSINRNHSLNYDWYVIFFHTLLPFISLSEKEEENDSSRSWSSGGSQSVTGQQYCSFSYLTEWTSWTGFIFYKKREESGYSWWTFHDLKMKVR